MKKLMVKSEMVRKLIDLPAGIIGVLEIQAKEKHMKVKPYIEFVLIEKTKDKK